MLQRLIFYLALVVSLPVYSQQLPIGLREEFNVILQENEGLAYFFKRLRMLEAGLIRKVSIVHIGDSHIQADQFSGRLRALFQLEFGSAGRGLVFPYQVALTSSPGDIYSTSNVAWEVKRNVFTELPQPIGVSGISIQTRASDFLLKLAIRKNEYGLDYGFDKVILFGEHTCKLYGWGNGQRFSVIPASDKSEYMVTTLQLSQDSDTLHIWGCQDSQTEVPYTILYGVSLENEQNTGILYHSIGVNGAKYTHYNQSRYFFSQLMELEPDLVIVSLGTNESMSKVESAGQFQDEVEKFLELLRRTLPQSSVLLTTPPDIGEKPLPLSQQVGAVLKESTVNHSLSCWDFQSVMGGPGSVKAWRIRNLVKEDMVHFTRQGYELQAELLWDAMMEAYKRYTRKNLGLRYRKDNSNDDD